MTEICVRCEKIIDDNKTMCLDCFEWALYHVEINGLNNENQKNKEIVERLRKWNPKDRNGKFIRYELLKGKNE